MHLHLSCACEAYANAQNMRYLKHVQTCRICDISSKWAFALCNIAASTHLKHVRTCRICDICSKCAFAVCDITANVHLKHVRTCRICDICTKCAFAVCDIAANAHLKHVRTCRICDVCSKCAFAGHLQAERGRGSFLLKNERGMRDSVLMCLLILYIYALESCFSQTAALHCNM